jgi:hypothetical protein
MEGPGETLGSPWPLFAIRSCKAMILAFKDVLWAAPPWLADRPLRWLRSTCLQGLMKLWNRQSRDLSYYTFIILILIVDPTKSEVFLTPEETQDSNNDLG